MTARAGDETAAANGALQHIGEPAIASLTAARAAARECRLAFGDVRDVVLRLHHWNFATAWTTPAADTDEALGPLSNRFPLPADCVAVRFVQDLAEDSWAVETALATDAAGAEIETMVLVTDTDAPLVCYTRRVESVRLWDPLFLKVFQFYLAARVGPAIGRDAQLGPALEEQGNKFLPTAKRVDSREGAPQQISRDTSWLRARRGIRT